MKVIINSKELSTALKDLAPAVPDRTTLPILNNVLVHVKNNKAELISLDLELTIIKTIECNSASSFSMLLPFSEFQNIALQMSDMPLTIENKENNIIVSSGLDVFRLGKAEEIDLFPTIPTFEAQYETTVDGEFFWALQQASKCVNKEQNKHPSLYFVCVEFSKGKISIVGSDGNCLFLDEIISDSAVEHVSLLPPDFITAVKKLETATICFSDAFFKAESGNMQIIVRLPDQRYVQYRSILPIPLNNCVADAYLFHSAINKLTFFRTPNNVYRSTFHFEIDKLKLSCQDTDFERDINSEIPVECNGDIEDMFFNARILQQVVGCSPPDCKALSLSIYSPSKGVLICPVSDYKVTLMIMPIA